MLGRIMVVLAIVVVGYFGINFFGFVIEIVILGVSVVVGIFFLVIILGVFDRCINWEGVISGMIVGLVFIIIYIIGIRFV